MPKHSIADLESNDATASPASPAPQAPQGAPAPTPGSDTQAAVSPQRSEAPALRTVPSSADVSGAGDANGRGQPLHPYWEGKPVTEKAIRLLQLWPRRMPAPLAIVQAAHKFAVSANASQAAYVSKYDAVDETAGICAATQVMVDAMATAHRELDEAAKAGGGPALGMLGGAPDLAPTDPRRVRWDEAAVLISKLQVALQRGYELGGAWRMAVETLSRPSWELEGTAGAEGPRDRVAPEGAGAAR